MIARRALTIALCIYLPFCLNDRSSGFIMQQKLLYPRLVDRLYQQNQNSLIWSGVPGSEDLRRELVNCLDTCIAYNLVSEAYHYSQLVRQIRNDSSGRLHTFADDRVFTDAAIACLKDVHQGYRMAPWVGFDPFSAEAESGDDQFLLDRLSEVHSGIQLRNLMESLQPTESEYQSLKRELRTQKQNADKTKIRELSLTLNYFRWIHHFHFRKKIIVNIASAYLRYFEMDSMVLVMKAVLGRPSTPTPRFAAWCDQVILYPYWYVPRSITLNEYLDRFKKNPALVAVLNMQVIDATGRVMDVQKLDWPSFNRSYFPYTLRQSTGCDNALGVIKFNLVSPYGVYLHDTNNQTAFFSGVRYYSHGCIRIESPIDLGNHLLNQQLDTAFLQSCYEDQVPIPIKMDEPVPVFVVYMPVEENRAGRLTYYKDVYKLLK